MPGTLGFASNPGMDMDMDMDYQNLAYYAVYGPAMHGASCSCIHGGQHLSPMSRLTLTTHAATMQVYHQ